MVGGGQGASIEPDVFTVLHVYLRKAKLGTFFPLSVQELLSSFQLYVRPRAPIKYIHALHVSIRKNHTVRA